ncbi:MAG: phage integrase family protein [Phycisphaerales bacterium]|nr:MAG: phage integrase family protein [Phycisphaerales bacterium]
MIPAGALREGPGCALPPDAQPEIPLNTAPPAAARPSTTPPPSSPARPRRFPAEVLRPNEVRALLDACGTTPAGLRTRALIAALYRAGLRLNEARLLRVKDLDPDARSIRVLHAKGGRARTVGIDHGGTALLIDWLEARKTLGHGVDGWVFCGRSGEPISASYVRVQLQRLGHRAGLDRRVHAHGFRHAHAAELRAEGVDVAVIRRQLGHASLATTIRYLDHLCPAAVVRAIQAREWEVGEVD